MYQISKLTGVIKKNGIVVIQDDRLQDWNDFVAYTGVIEYVDFFDDELSQYNRNLLPKRVSQRQLRTQLVLNGFDLNNIQTVINSLPEPNKSISQVAWDYAITFERDSDLLSGIAFSLGLNETQVDEIFTNASLL